MFNLFFCNWYKKINKYFWLTFVNVELEAVELTFLTTCNLTIYWSILGNVGMRFPMLVPLITSVRPETCFDCS